RYGIPGWKADLVASEADAVLGGLRGYVLTYKNGVPVGTAGIDRSNAPPGYVTLHPRDPDREARRVSLKIRRELGIRVGVIIVDSHLNLLRRGVSGVAIGSWGVSPLRDLRGERDIYGRRMRFTVVNVIDSLAAAAALVMGETSEMTPFALIRWEGVSLEDVGSEEARVPPEECYVLQSIVDGFCLGST
ncbi:MAG: hypothetical protein DRO06_03845, partial [Thermoproteota archaeon]